MNRIHQIGIQFVSVIALLLALAPASVGAARTEYYTTTYGQHTVEWSGRWELDSTDESPSGEMLLFTNERDISVMGVMFLPSGYDLESIRDLALEGFQEDGTSLEVVDYGSYNNVAYELDRMEWDGVDVGLFTLVIDRSNSSGDTTAIMFLAPIADFSESMTAAQDQMTVDGQVIFDGINAHSLERQLSGRSSSSASSGSVAYDYVNPDWGYTVEYTSQWDSGADVGDFSISVSSPETIVGFTGVDIEGLSMREVYNVVQPEFWDALPGGSYMLAEEISRDRVLLAAWTPDGTFVQEVISTPSGNGVLVTMITEGRANPVISDIQDTVEVDDVTLFADWT